MIALNEAQVDPYLEVAAFIQELSKKSEELAKVQKKLEKEREKNASLNKRINNQYARIHARNVKIDDLLEKLKASRQEVKIYQGRFKQEESEKNAMKQEMQLWIDKFLK